MDYLVTLYGAHSITRTVLGYYGQLPDDEDEEAEELEDDELVARMKTVCAHEGIEGEPVTWLQEILELIAAFRAKQDKTVTPAQSAFAEEKCQAYVNWVFTSFPCFEKGEDGRYYFYPREA
jgi:hypothetical protein